MEYMTVEQSLGDHFLGDETFENPSPSDKNQDLNSSQIVTESHLYFQLPNIAKQMFNKAGELKKQNRLDEALDVLYSILKEVPNSALIYGSIGFIFFLKKRYNEAIEFLTKTIELEPNFISAYYDRGFNYLMLKKYKEAEEDAQKTLSMDENSVQALSLKGLVYERLQKVKEAESIFRQVLEKAPTLKSYTNLIRISLVQKNFEEAWNFTNEVLKIEPNNNYALCVQARILCDQQQYEKALQMVNKVLSVSPNHYGATNILVTIYKKLGRNDEAINLQNQLNQKVQSGLYDIPNDLRYPNQLNMQHPGMIPGKPIVMNGIPIQQQPSNLIFNLQAIIKNEKEKNKALEEKLKKIGQEIESLKQSHPNLNEVFQHLTQILKDQAPLQQANQMSNIFMQPQQMSQMPQTQHQQQFPQYPQQGIPMGNPSMQMQMNHQGGSDMMMDDE